MGATKIQCEHPTLVLVNCVGVVGCRACGELFTSETVDLTRYEWLASLGQYVRRDDLPAGPWAPSAQDQRWLHGLRISAE